MRRRRLPTPLGLLLAVTVGALGLLAIYATRPDPPRPIAPDPGPVPVRLRTLAPETRPLEETVYGETAPLRVARLSAEQSGRVIWRSPALEVGGAITAEDDILKLDDEPLRLQRATAAAALTTAEAEVTVQLTRVAAAESALSQAEEQERVALRDLARQRTLVAEGAASESLRDQAESAWLAAVDGLDARRNALGTASAALEAARAGAAQAAAALDQTDDAVRRAVVKAPFSGLVTRPRVEVGDWLVPGSPLCELVDLSKVRIEVRLPTGAATPTRARVRFPAMIDETGVVREEEARIVGLDPVARSDSRSRSVVLEIDNPGTSLPAGAFAVAVLNGGEREALWIRPAEYLSPGGRARAFVVGADDVAHVRELRLGRPLVDAGSRAWHPVLDGLLAGERLVTDNLEVLRDGALVSVLDG